MHTKTFHSVCCLLKWNITWMLNPLETRFINRSCALDACLQRAFGKFSITSTFLTLKRQIASLKLSCIYSDCVLRLNYAESYDDSLDHDLVTKPTWVLLANVNSRSRSLYAVARPFVVCLSSVVCNVRTPYSGSSNFLQYFYGIRYLGHPLTSSKFHGDRPRGTPPPGELNTREVAKYSDFGPIVGYTSETVQDRR